MNTKPLNDEELDAIVGGSSYVSELSGFLQMSSIGQPCLKVTYSKSGSSVSMLGHLDCPLTDKGMTVLIRIADRCGQVTLTDAQGNSKAFTSDALKAML